MLVLVAALLPVAGGAAVLLPRDGDGLNQPHSATISSEAMKLVMPSDASRIDYTYDGTGLKHQTVHTTVTKYTLGNKVLTRTKRDTTRYVGSRIYENGQLDRVLTPYGYIRNGVHHTFLHDYRGNVAAVVAGDSLVQRTFYYPYGLPHANAHGATANPYKYSGKEFDTFGGTDLYDFHARYHAPSTGRFMTVDPMAEKYPGISPYMYCAGNPIAYIDPDGMQIFVNIDDMIYYYR
ncbi:MAG: RHS repeat-associated core domain-containing protein, partial [Duncaniella sp.]|nr:RHS repeat-associated core domain-containing protein [Duncaniella sp.]